MVAVIKIDLNPLGELSLFSMIFDFTILLLSPILIDTYLHHRQVYNGIWANRQIILSNGLLKP